MRSDFHIYTMMVALLAGAAAAAATTAAVVQEGNPDAKITSFADDVSFLQAHTNVLVLRDKKGTALVAIVPAWQGRVMTTSAESATGHSFGWINRALVASGKLAPHINAFGGEDRLWLGPEGGQFSIYFSKGAAFDYAHWFVPQALDIRPFETVRRARDRAAFRSTFTVTNYQGTSFNVRVEREVRVLEQDIAWKELGTAPSGSLTLVAYESVNTLTNVGKVPWRRETGLLSIWVLGMFTSSPSSAVVVPIKYGPESELGAKVTSDYFGDVPSDRLKVTDSAVFLRADAKFRCKIGVSPKRSLGTLASYDPDHRILTIVKFNQPPGIEDYVNSRWALQRDPYRGDAANSYNDGPPSPGASPLGSFFELESSSPAAALAPGQSFQHTRRTFHVAGPEQDLDAVARAVLGVSLMDVQLAFHSG